MKIQSVKTTFSVIALSAVLTACGGGGSDETSANFDIAPQAPSESSTIETSQTETQPTVQVSQKLTGTLTDSPIANVSYSTTSGLSGKTDANGKFSYAKGDSITFYIGDLVFPSVNAQDIITPLELFGTTDIRSPRVINALRLLQSLDDDGQIEEAITLTDTAVQAIDNADLRLEDFSLSTVEFESLPAVSEILSAAGTNARSLISESEAISHFSQYVIHAKNIDSDNDGIANSEDSDDDNDGIPDLADSTPLTPEAPKPIAVTPEAQEPVVVIPVVQEPAVVIPVVQEPVVITPVIQEPVAVTPVVQEPVVVTPEVQEPVVVAPVVQEPVVEEIDEAPAITDEVVAQAEDANTEDEPTFGEVIDQQEETIADGTPIVDETPITETPDNQVLFDALISWEAPAARENGDLLSTDDIGGFEIKYRNILDGNYTSIKVSAATATSYTITDLTTGSYEVLIATIDSDGVYSDFSSPVTYTLGS